jgi:hypothetical protein
VESTTGWTKYVIQLCGGILIFAIGIIVGLTVGLSDRTPTLFQEQQSINQCMEDTIKGTSIVNPTLSNLRELNSFCFGED